MRRLLVTRREHVEKRRWVIGGQKQTTGAFLSEELRSQPPLPQTHTRCTHKPQSSFIGATRDVFGDEEGGGGGGGALEPKKLCAQQGFPNGKFRFFPQWSLWSGGGGGWHKAWVSDCLPLAAPIGLSPLLIRTLCGPERVLVVSMEPPDDWSCLTTPGVGRPGDGAVASAVDQVHPDAHSESTRGFADSSTDLCTLGCASAG